MNECTIFNFSSFEYKIFFANLSILLLDTRGFEIYFRHRKQYFTAFVCKQLSGEIH